MDEDEETWALTEDGMNVAIDMHAKILSGWTIEEVASHYGYDIDMIKVMLVFLFHMADESDIPIVIVPDTLEGIE